MLEKLKNLYYALDETHLIGVFSALTALVSWIASVSGIDCIQILSVKMLNLSLVTLFTSAYLSFLYGKTYDIRKEILEEHNIAAAIYASAIYLGNALVVTLNS